MQNGGQQEILIQLLYWNWIMLENNIIMISNIPRLKVQDDIPDWFEIIHTGGLKN